MTLSIMGRQCPLPFLTSALQSVRRSVSSTALPKTTIARVCIAACAVLLLLLVLMLLLSPCPAGMPVPAGMDA